MVLSRKSSNFPSSPENHTNRDAISGLFAYTVLNTLIYLVVKISRGSITPENWQHKEIWTWRPAGEKPLLLRIFSREKSWKDKRVGAKEPPLVGGGESTASLHTSVRTSVPGDSTLGAGSATGAEEKQPADPIHRVPSPRPFRTTQF